MTLKTCNMMSCVNCTLGFCYIIEHLMDCQFQKPFRNHLKSHLSSVCMYSHVTAVHIYGGWLISHTSNENLWWKSVSTKGKYKDLSICKLYCICLQMDSYREKSPQQPCLCLFLIHISVSVTFSCLIVTTGSC